MPKCVESIWLVVGCVATRNVASLALRASKSSSLQRTKTPWVNTVEFIAFLLLLACLALGAQLSKQQKLTAAALGDLERAEAAKNQSEDLVGDVRSNLRRTEGLLELARAQAASLEREAEHLAKYRPIRDVETHIEELRTQAAAEMAQTKSQCAKDKRTAQKLLDDARDKAGATIAAAETRAEEIAGSAYDALRRSRELQETVSAMKNRVEGYGDQYLLPAYSLLDELAEDFGFDEAGQELKASRKTTRATMVAGRAATCEYVEPVRKTTAIRFVLDAFNGKVDSILSRSKAGNYGKLEQEIRDAYALVNHNGAAFRGARVTEEFLDARLCELKWAAAAHALKAKERAEQRALQEQLRDEESARREYERVAREAAQEEETVRRAVEQAKAQIGAANDMQRAALERKLEELQARLQEAERRNQRALSMAQQTRAGHVYVISNIGSFGEHVYKIGMTRRLDPLDRVTELGDASVPFEFDVHAMIFSDDAPALEKALHHHFLGKQVNKVNPRKEFFRIDLTSIRRELEQLGVETLWTMTAEAAEYRATRRIEQGAGKDAGALADESRHPHPAGEEPWSGP